MLASLSDRFSKTPYVIIAGIFLAASLIEHLGGMHFPVDPAWLCIVFCGYPLVYLAISRLIKQRWISSALLISIAMFASLAIGEIFAAGEVAFIMAIGAILEEKTVERARRGLEDLLAIRPKQGRLIRDGKEVMVNVEEIKRGDVLRSLPGESISVDGIVVSGFTTVDQSILTGESLPIEVEAGSEVFSGTMNINGSIDYQAVSVGEDSSISKMIQLIEEASQKQAPVQRIADKWATWLVPIALMISLATILISYAVGLDMSVALRRSVTVLIVFCPCALALATPTSVMAAIAQAAKHGVIIKSGLALEQMGKVDTIVFDKTGTLTQGKIEVEEIVVLDSTISEEKALQIITSLESKSEHPFAKAVLKRAGELGISVLENENFSVSIGGGVQGKIGNEYYFAGNERFLKSQNIMVSDDALVELEKQRKSGRAAVLLAHSKSAFAIFSFSDPIRTEAKEVIEELKNTATQTYLLTGDHKNTAMALAKEIPFKEVYAQVLPENKVEHVQELQKQNHVVCMVGDGINDTPALKLADVGVAMGKLGSELAVETADIALMGEDLKKLSYLRRLSQGAIRTIKGNIIASMIINAVAITCAVLGVLTPVTGALVHNAGSVLVVLNAALLYDRNFKK